MLPVNLENENLVLSYLMRNLHRVNVVAESDFRNVGSRSIFLALKRMADNELEFGLQSLFAIVHEYNPNLKFQSLEILYNKYVDFSNIDKHISDLKKLGHLSEIVVTLNDLHSGKKYNTDQLVTQLQIVSKKIQDIPSNRRQFYSSTEMVNSYSEILDQRRNPDFRRTSYGYPSLDKNLTRPAAPGETSIIAGLPGTAKSIFKQGILDKLTSRKIPVIDFSFEMSLESTMDRWAAMLADVSLMDLNKKLSRPGMEIKLQNFMSRMRERESYLFVDQAFMDLNDIEALIQDAKAEFRKRGLLGKDDNYIFCAFDMLNMVGNYQSQSAQDIARATNDWFAMIARQRVHGLGLVHINETKFRQGRTVFKCVDDIDTYRPSLEDIYGGGGYTQRARTVFILNRRKKLKQLYFPHLEEEWSMEPDIIQTHCVKQNDGALFFTEFEFNTDYMQITPYGGVQQESGGQVLHLNAL